MPHFSSGTTPDCDIFCKVVDNFGDIGVCWRLARQMASEHAREVRLWVDNLTAFHQLAPAIKPEQPCQTLGEINVLAWTSPFPDCQPARLIIQTFGCDLPETYLAAMAQQKPAPNWINLEYLSAEDWVEGCHNLASPHPQLPLTCRFFFPGFTDQTGGLLRERGLPETLHAFGLDRDAQLHFWQKVTDTPPAPDALRISLFSYENPALPALLETWAAGPHPVFCAVTAGHNTEQVHAWAGNSQQHGNLTLAYIPFLAQPDYDLLLAACDLNFVRGEDSFVRAQWAGRPFVWHIYQQAENAHRIKLAAFLDKYLADLDPTVAGAWRNFWLAWDEDSNAAGLWAGICQHLPTLQAHATRWAEVLGGREDLCAKLLICDQNLVQ